MRFLICLRNKACVSKGVINTFKKPGFRTSPFAPPPTSCRLAFHESSVVSISQQFEQNSQRNGWLERLRVGSQRARQSIEREERGGGAARAVRLGIEKVPEYVSWSPIQIQKGVANRWTHETIFPMFRIVSITCSHGHAAFSAVLSTEGRVVGLCWAKLKPKGPKGCPNSQIWLI